MAGPAYGCRGGITLPFEVPPPPPFPPFPPFPPTPRLPWPAQAAVSIVTLAVAVATGPAEAWASEAGRAATTSDFAAQSASRERPRGVRRSLTLLRAELAKPDHLLLGDVLRGRAAFRQHARHDLDRSPESEPHACPRPCPRRAAPAGRRASAESPRSSPASPRTLHRAGRPAPVRRARAARRGSQPAHAC